MVWMFFKKRLFLSYISVSGDKISRNLSDNFSVKNLRCFQQMLLTLHSGHLVLNAVVKYLSSPPLRGNMQNFRAVCNAIFQARISSTQTLPLRIFPPLFTIGSYFYSSQTSRCSDNRFRLLSTLPASNLIYLQNSSPNLLSLNLILDQILFLEYSSNYSD